MNIADKLISKNSDFESELAKMQSTNGESLTLYTSYFTAFYYIPDNIWYDNTGYMTNENRATRLVVSDWVSKNISRWRSRVLIAPWSHCPNLNRIAQFVHKLLRGTPNLEIRSRDAGHAHLGVVL